MLIAAATDKPSSKNQRRKVEFAHVSRTVLMMKAH